LPWVKIITTSQNEKLFVDLFPKMGNSLPIMQTMVPLTIDIAAVPIADRQVLLAEATRRGVTLETLMREALQEKAESIEAAKKELQPA
jgi:hypothetical protein